MENKKLYRTSSGGAVTAIIFAIVMVFITLLNPQQLNGWAPWAFILFLLTAAIDTKLGIYVYIVGNEFYSVSHFLLKRRTHISDIARIIYQPTWIIGQRQRSVYLIEAGTNRIKAKMANAAYARTTLSQLVNDLKQNNPRIELDKETQELLQGKR
jgi:hypothetical protein